jgi:Trk-type K+ transport system membrane component
LIKTLALQAETAINKLNVMEEESIRYLIAHTISSLYRKYETVTHNSRKNRYEKRTINDIKKKKQKIAHVLYFFMQYTIVLCLTVFYFILISN